MKGPRDIQRDGFVSGEIEDRAEPYKKTTALLIQFEEDTSRDADVKDLEKMLRSTYNATVGSFKIKSDRSEYRNLLRDISSFLKENSGGLRIIYYTANTKKKHTADEHPVLYLAEGKTKVSLEFLQKLIEGDDDCWLLSDCDQALPNVFGGWAKGAVIAAVAEGYNNADQEKLEAGCLSFARVLLQALGQLSKKDGTLRRSTDLLLYSLMEEEMEKMDEKRQLVHQSLSVNNDVPVFTFNTTTERGPFQFTIINNSVRRR